LDNHLSRISSFETNHLDSGQRFVIIGMGGLVFLVLAGFSPDAYAGGIEPPDTYDVSIPSAASNANCSVIENQCYSPDFLTVGLGDVVRWTNNDSLTHTSTSFGSLPWNSGFLSQNDQFSFTMSAVGIHDYACTIHPWMTGTIKVVNPGGISIPLDSSLAGNCDVPNTCFNPEFITVGSGDNVTWMNDDTIIHTVTSGTPGGGPDGLWDSDDLGAGEDFSIVAPQVGTYDYYCKLHPWQTGVLDVVDLISNPIQPTIPKGSITINLQLVASELIAPVHLTNAGDNRRFIVDQPGEIRILTNNVLLPTPFLDIKSDIIELGFFGSMDENDFDERGLLGLAFHPNYNNSGQPGFGKLYTFSSEPVSGPGDFSVTMSGLFDNQNVIHEWEVDQSDADIVDISTKREIMRVDEPQFNHQGGKLEFGPDGYLYISFGDGGGADDNQDGHGSIGNGQDRSTILGTIIRIDPLHPNDNPSSIDTISENGQYRVPKDNPFLLDDNALDEIYAFGFRNPWRFSFDSMNGDLVVADVGQNLIEEIDIVHAGGNYGWPAKEGTFSFDSTTSPVSISFDLEGLVGNLLDPISQYDHGEGISITGGYVYRGTQIPELVGKYVFGDFSSTFASPDGRIFYANLTSGQIEEFILDGGDLPLGTYVKSTGIDSSGELYFLVGANLGPFETSGGQRLGQVLKIVPSAECTIPDFGDMVIESDCTLTTSETAPANVSVQNNSTLTILNGVTLDIDFTNFNLTIKSGSGVLIKSGGTIT